MPNVLSTEVQCLLRRRAILAVFFLLWSLTNSLAQSPSKAVEQWTRFEAGFTSANKYTNALQDVRFTVRFSAPSQKTHEVDGFWDGEQSWKVRFSPEEVGEWSYVTICSDEKDNRLHNQSGRFLCKPYTGRNALYRHGALRLSGNRRFIEHADGTPFFWLADTCWAGALLSSEKDWNTYLADRKGKHFNTIQFMGTQNIAAAGDAQGRQAYGGRERITIDPYFFRRLDERVNAINEHGLIASPTFCWAAKWHPSGEVLDPGAWLPDDQVILLSRYFLARYGAHQVVWMFAGDADYRGEKAERWRKLGRSIFGEQPHRLVTVHPDPRALLKKEFGAEPWLGFLGYQSSHSSRDQTIRWIVQGEPAQEWKSEPVRPIINIEPIYEQHMNFGKDRLATAYDVRQAAWWSVLVSPTAGVSYGAHGVWSWETQPAIPMNHYQTGVARPWHQAIRLIGSTHMKHLYEFFATIPWWNLSPAPEILELQPGKTIPERFIAAARSTDGQTTVLYLPSREPATLKVDQVGPNIKARWFDPTNGRFQTAKSKTVGNQLEFLPPEENASGDHDFVLLLESTGKLK